MIVENLPVPFDVRVWKEALALREEGYEVSVICPAGRGYPSGYELRDGVHVHRHPMPPEGESKLAFLREYGAALFHELRLARRIRRERGFDAVHICNPPDLLFLVAGWLRLVGGVRVVFDHHDLAPELFATKFPGSAWLRPALLLAERATFRVADRVISSNAAFRELAITRGGKSPDRVHVVMNAPDPDVFRPRPPDPAVRAGRAHLVGYVGHIGSQYGIDDLVRAAAHIVRTRGREDVHFMIIGDGPLLGAMRGLAAELDVDGHVEFTGALPHDEIPRRIGSCDVGVVPVPANPYSDRSTAIKTLEYMALGKPVVEYDRTASREAAGEAALYAKPGDPGDFGDRILWLVDHPDERRRMGELGRRRVEEMFAWPTHAERLREAYRLLFAEGDA